MRSNTSRDFGRLLLTGLAVVAFAALSWAQAATPQARAGKVRERVELIKELHAAHKLLAEADHDYNGKRAAAAEEVHKAIHELEGNHHAKKAASGTPAAGASVVKAAAAAPAKGKGSMHESQQTSDAQLNQALKILHGVQGEVNAHHPKAGANVAAAIGHINAALKIK